MVKTPKEGCTKLSLQCTQGHHLSFVKSEVIINKIKGKGVWAS